MELPTAFPIRDPDMFSNFLLYLLLKEGLFFSYSSIFLSFVEKNSLRKAENSIIFSESTLISFIKGFLS